MTNVRAMARTLTSPKTHAAAPTTVRTSVCWSRLVYDFAAEDARRRGFRSVSSYVEYIVRLRQEPDSLKP